MRRTSPKHAKATLESLARELGRESHSIQTSLCEYDKFMSWSLGIRPVRKRITQAVCQKMSLPSYVMLLGKLCVTKRCPSFFLKCAVLLSQNNCNLFGYRMNMVGANFINNGLCGPINSSFCRLLAFPQSVKPGLFVKS